MHNDRIAEFLLESVTTRERAASTLGDLRETAATRSEAWFWSCVLGTTVSLLWRAMVADPRRMLGLALRAWLLALAMGATLTIVDIFFVGWVIGFTQDAGEGSVGFTVFSLFPALLCSMAITQFFVGRWIAKRAPGRELPACVAFVIVQLVASCAVQVALMLARHDKSWLVLARDSSRFILTDVFCFLGALSVRRRASRTAE
jgi:hypothetical protein